MTRSIITAAVLYLTTIASLGAQDPGGGALWEGVFTADQAERGRSQ